VILEIVAATAVLLSLASPRNGSTPSTIEPASEGVRPSGRLAASTEHGLFEDAAASY
jgi:hypothetical protein